MLPLMPGPDPSAFGALAAILLVGAGGALVAIAALVGWTALEFVCLLEGYGET
ncbi:hypothetical protein [Aureimonas flava]|uniref:hypothetical protein n=1 Tax=Aureimonas flava TaxID=2320271 RepID=UPI00145A0042|nr:hypothetical protein [Aureimonas flava]